MIKLRPYEQGDAFKLVPLSVFAPILETQFTVDEFASKVDDEAIAHTFYLEEPEEIIAIIGLRIARPGLAEGWALLSDGIKIFPIEFHKRVLNFIRFHTKYFSIRRWQVTVKADFEVGNKWIKALGFSYEGCLKKFSTNGDDYSIWGRT